MLLQDWSHCWERFALHRRADQRTRRSAFVSTSCSPPNAKAVLAREDPDPLQPSRRAMVLVSIGHQTEPVPTSLPNSHPLAGKMAVRSPRRERTPAVLRTAPSYVAVSFACSASKMAPGAIGRRVIRTPIAW